MNALGAALTAHRDTCTTCTRYRACGIYLHIVTAHTDPRKRWAGPVAPRTVLSVRESPEVTA